MADKQQDTVSGVHQGKERAKQSGETLDADLKAEDQRRTQPQDREAEEELSGSPT